MVYTRQLVYEAPFNMNRPCFEVGRGLELAWQAWSIRPSGDLRGFRGWCALEMRLDPEKV